MMELVKYLLCKHEDSNFFSNMQIKTKGWWLTAIIQGMAERRWMHTLGFAGQPSSLNQSVLRSVTNSI